MIDAGTRAKVIRHVGAPVTAFLAVSALFGLHLAHLLPRAVDTRLSTAVHALANASDAFQSYGPSPSRFTEKHPAWMTKLPSELTDEEIVRRAEYWHTLSTNVVAPLRTVIGVFRDAGAPVDESALKAKIERDLLRRDNLKEQLRRSFHDQEPTASVAGTTEDPSPGTPPLASLASAPSGTMSDAASELPGLVATLFLLEWLLIWVWREHHEVIATHVGDRLGLPAGSHASAPRLRFGLSFFGLKVWRMLRFFLFVGLLVIAGD